MRFLPDILTQDVWGFWEEREASGYYRSLMHMLYMAVYGLAGLSPWAFHLLNVVFHAAASLAVLMLVRERRGDTELALTLPLILLTYDYARGGRRLQKNLAKHFA